MNRRQVKDIGASVRQRLLNLARERSEEFQLVLTRYALERLLYRLGQSTYRERFLLKGAMLFSVWAYAPHRATRDLDLLGRGDNAVESQKQIFMDVCKTAVEEDGLLFDTESIRGEQLHEADEYSGVRLAFGANLAGARIPIQVDIGFGDAVNPPPEEVDYPTLLDLPAPRLLAYPREAVVAEKFQAMVVLGIGNSRMKDFYDLAILARRYPFDGRRVGLAIVSTFARRGTPLPTPTPVALTPEFSQDPAKQTQWKAFLRRGRLGGVETELAEAIDLLKAFLMTPTTGLLKDGFFDMVWPMGGPWQPRDDRGTMVDMIRETGRGSLAGIDTIVPRDEDRA